MSNTKLLIHCNGENNSTTFIDDSGNNKTITTAGIAKVKTNIYEIMVNTGAIISTSIYKFGLSSLYLNGSSKLSTIDVDNDFNFGNGDFAIDCWIYPTELTSYNGICTQRSNASSNKSWLFSSNGTKLYFSYSTNGTSTTGTLTSSADLTLNVWQHVAVERVGTTVYLYINGTKDSNTLNISTNTIYNSSADVSIGLNPGATEYFEGYIDELRVTKGINRYNATSFTPQTQEYEVDSYTKLLLHMSGNNNDVEIYDSVNSYNMKFSQALSIYPTVGNYIYADDSEDFNFGNGDFTVDFWMFANRLPNINVGTHGDYTALFSQRTGHNSNQSISFFLTSKDLDGWYLGISYDGSTEIGIRIAYSFSTYTWYHIAVIRNGADLNVYIDGILSNTYNISTNALYNSTSPFKIGAASYTGGDDAHTFDGYIDEFRVSKGIARWTSNFTPPIHEYGQVVRFDLLKATK